MDYDKVNFDETFCLMNRTFCDFENLMSSKPAFVKLSFGEVFRFKEKNIYQVMIQKLACVQSLVRAAHILLHNGYVQEQAMLQRAIDETNEDIMFLVYAVTDESIIDLRKRYLEAFWQEEIDESGTLIDSKQKHPMIPREKLEPISRRSKALNWIQAA